jgi:hypothetical protein
MKKQAQPQAARHDEKQRSRSSRAAESRQPSRAPDIGVDRLMATLIEMADASDGSDRSARRSRRAFPSPTPNNQTKRK